MSGRLRIRAYDRIGAHSRRRLAGRSLISPVALADERCLGGAVLDYQVVQV
jgi:hypothetical protein